MEALGEPTPRGMGEHGRSDRGRPARGGGADRRRDLAAGAGPGRLEPGQQADQVVVARRRQSRSESDQLDRRTERCREVTCTERPELAGDESTSHAEPWIGQPVAAREQRPETPGRRHLGGHGARSLRRRRQPARCRQPRGTGQRRGPAPRRRWIDRDTRRGDRPAVRRGQECHPALDPGRAKVGQAAEQDPARYASDVVERQDKQSGRRPEVHVHGDPVNAANPTEEGACSDVRCEACRGQGGDGVRQDLAPVTDSENEAIVWTLGWARHSHNHTVRGRISCGFRGDSGS